MKIPINIKLDSSVTNHHHLPPVLAQFGTHETFLLELQGSIHVEGNKFGTVEDPEVGVVGIFDATNESKPSIQIGHHYMEGKIVNLPKPLAVIVKSSSLDSSQTDPAAGGETSRPTFDMISIVKRKVVFSTRPMPRMSTAHRLTGLKGSGTGTGPAPPGKSSGVGKVRKRA